MPATGATRKSARVQAKQGNQSKASRAVQDSKSTAGQNSDDNIDSDGLADADNSEDSSCVTKGSKAKRKPAKRAKTKKDAAELIRKPRGKGARTVGKLSALLQLPMDILFEVWRFLPPATLLALLQVNSLFRETLQAGEAISIWINVRKSCKAPDPLPGFTEIQWVRYLFGSKICHICKKKKTDEPYFEYRIRVCSPCFRKVSLTAKKLKSKYREWYMTLKDLLPTQCLDPDAENIDEYTEDDNVYYLNDAEEVVRGLQACQGKQELDTYINKRKAYLEDYNKRVEECYNWAEMDYDRQEDEKLGLIKMRNESMNRKLAEMGYSEMDIKFSGTFLTSTGKRDAPLTEKGWTAVRSKVVTILEKSRLCRSFDPEATGELLERRQMLSRVYDAYKATLQPIQTRSLPQLSSIILELPVVHPLFDALRTVTQDDFDEILDQLKVDILQFIRKMAPHASTASLANCLVECYCCFRTFCGWDSALRHFNCPKCCFSKGRFEAQYGYGEGESRPLISMDPRFFSAGRVDSLIVLSGGNPESTTTDEMDEKSCVFECDRVGRAFLGTWREALDHERKAHNVLTRPRFDLVENSDFEDKRVCWSWSQCHAHVLAPTTRAEVVAHLNSEHNVPAPKVPKDFLYVGHECDEKEGRMKDLGLETDDSHSIGDGWI
ncbi:hypothetical protein PQX77_021843 [Marasmius sp. AFHP31]|nr:hypothetical protein PQX77_021843 [Marasmius sp. AFHP31]